ncbi:MAG: adenylate/guanylate cyclase domain-containing protein [Ginsengibacter sp.]
MNRDNNKATNKILARTLVKKPLHFWNTIINIGIDTYTNDFDKKRTRLINGICSWAFVIYLIYVITYATDESVKFVFYESLLGVIGYAIPIVINYFKKHNLACHFFTIFNLFFYLEQSLSGGRVTGVEYIFVPCSVTAMLFFKKPPLVFFYFVMNMLFFGLAKFSFSHLQPLFVYNNEAHSIYIANHITMFVILFMIIYYYKSENARQEKLLALKNESLTREKQKSDNLLLNILPVETAEELKRTGTAKSRRFNMVTVMFTDFKGFTKISERLDPEKLVGEIDRYFSYFDEVIMKHDLEKIKTIGDSYLCVGGMPEESNSHADDVVLAALEIQEFMQQQKNNSHDGLFFELRIGIHTGPVVAGIVGTKKFAYDIWGDTVNTASRMESTGEAGKVNISGTTYQLVKDNFTCLPRGKIAAKGKGDVDMFFVENEKNRASIN